MIEELQRCWAERVGTLWVPRVEEFETWLQLVPAEVLLYAMRRTRGHLRRANLKPEQFLEDEIVNIFDSFLEKTNAQYLTPEAFQ